MHTICESGVWIRIYALLFKTLHSHFNYRHTRHNFEELSITIKKIEGFHYNQENLLKLVPLLTIMAK